MRNQGFFGGAGLRPSTICQKPELVVNSTRRPFEVVLTLKIHSPMGVSFVEALSPFSGWFDGNQNNPAILGHPYFDTYANDHTEFLRPVRSNNWTPFGTHL